MTAPTGPTRASPCVSSSSIEAAASMVAMIMPETGSLELPTSPAMYPETEQNRNASAIIASVIGMLINKLPTTELYISMSGTEAATTPSSA